MVGYGGADVMDFHALEALQCMVERRKGGETGVRAVQMIEGDAVWKAGDDGRCVEGAAGGGAVAERLAPGPDRSSDGRTQDLVGEGRAAEAGQEPGGLLHRVSRRAEGDAADAERRGQGLHVRRAREGSRRPVDAVLPDARAERDLFGVPGRKIEEMFETGKAPYPVERTLLVSGMLESCLTSRLDGQKRWRRRTWTSAIGRRSSPSTAH